MGKELKRPEVSKFISERNLQKQTENDLSVNGVLIPVEDEDGGIEFQEPEFEDTNDTKCI